jgi:hypothetical protein
MLSLQQSLHIQHTIVKFNMQESNEVKYPTGSQRLSPLQLNERPCPSETPYRQIVGSLVYLVEMTRPDLTFAVHQLSCYTHNPGVKHWKAAKQVVKYLKGTETTGVRYTRTNSFELVGFCDADFAPEENNRRSTTGYVFLLAGSPISWKTTLQKRVTLSTCEAELEAMLEATKEALYLRKALEAFGFELTQPTSLYCDNKSSIRITKEPCERKRTKHLDIKFLFMRQAIKEGKVALSYVPSNENLADLFTKPLVGHSFSDKTKLLLYTPLVQLEGE